MSSGDNRNPANGEGGDEKNDDRSGEKQQNNNNGNGDVLEGGDIEMADAAESENREERPGEKEKQEGEEAGKDEQSKWEEDVLSAVAHMTTGELIAHTRLFDEELAVLRSDLQWTTNELRTKREELEHNEKQIKHGRKLPLVVSNVVEVLDPWKDQTKGEEEEEVGGYTDLSLQAKSRCSIVKVTSTRGKYFFPNCGLLDPAQLMPGDLVAVKRSSYMMIECLPRAYDSRIKAMELDEKPTETYSDVGGLDQQIQELMEAVVLPLTHADRFKNLGIHPPKGVLMYGPPGTGKTLLARACAAQTSAKFMKLSATQLVQCWIGGGSKLVRDAFALAKEKAPTIIFIDEIDAIGKKRYSDGRSGSREVQRTMMELLSQMDGFSQHANIKVIGATNRVDILDPALMRSGRFDRKIELPHPTEHGRATIMRIHSRKMNVAADVDFQELSRDTDDFNGAQCKAVCVEAGMIALRRDAKVITHNDFADAILEVQAKKKVTASYFL